VPSTRHERQCRICHAAATKRWQERRRMRSALG
jgi:hypothetical protein